jgi:release factor glutamine methyltransferase
MDTHPPSGPSSSPAGASRTTQNSAGGSASGSAGARGATAKRWTTRELLNWTAGHFRERQLDAPRVCAEMLLSHVIGCDRMRLYMEVDRPASAAELAQLRELVTRATKHEPVQYLVGHAWFFSRRFEVDRSTLIPRPATEALVERILTLLRQREVTAPRVLDLATGSGCIAVSVAAQLPAATVVATDLVPAAIELATRNATTHGVADRIEFRVGSLWEPILADERFDVIAANPPYISDAEWAEVPPNVKSWEPASALRGGPDGLELVRPIVAGARAHLSPGGVLLIEIAASQETGSLRIAREAGFEGPSVIKDFEGLPRVLVAEV